MDIGLIKDLMDKLSPEDLAEVEGILEADQAERLWVPLDGPQWQAYTHTADVIGYGGAAGGGKTDLACGLALTKHKKTAIFRREGTELTAIEDRLEELLGTRDGYNSQRRIWRLGTGKQIEFGSVPNAGDETKYQGRPKDLLVLDEAANFLESQARFLMGWVRSTDPLQQCSTLMCFNPPTSADGQWIVKYFGPWLDPGHENPARPGDIRWFAMVDGEEIEVPNGKEFKWKGELMVPESRTFIPSRLRDNPYLASTGYMATLQAMPEPLRSQMLHGDFSAGLEDDVWQVIPSAWVDAAQARWKLRERRGEMMSMGVDVARGGRDKTQIARRHGYWYDKLIEVPHKDAPDGPAVAAQVLMHRREAAPVHVDAIGVGASVYDQLISNGVQAIAMVGSESAHGLDKTANFEFFNRRSELYWRMREALDPTSDTGIALPPDSGLKADLCAPTYSVRGGTPPKIQVEPKEKLIDRIGRSPDKADAVVMALVDTKKSHRKYNRQDLSFTRDD